MTTLTLGDITFQDFEVPEYIRGLGGSQAMAVHRFPGGKRAIHSMGADDDQVTWDGRFRGLNAQARVRRLDALRRAGQALPLTVGELSLVVVIRTFTFDWSVQEIPYQIALEVQTNNSAFTPSETPGAGEVIGTDAKASLALATAVADPVLVAETTAIGSAISRVGDFGRASTATIAGVLGPVRNAQARTLSLIEATEEMLGRFPALGNVVPGLRVTQMTGDLMAQVNAAADAARLWDLNGILGRLGVNLNSIGAAGADVVVAGGDLFDLARRQYGDATEWATIARANGVTDPRVEGVQTITVPPLAQNTGGVLR